MKIKNVKLKYNVMRYDWNSKKVVPSNILGYIKIDDLVKRIRKGEINSRETLSSYIDKELRYYCWSRAECEIMITDLLGDMSHAEKIDMYYQAKLNFDILVDYVIETMDIRFER